MLDLNEAAFSKRFGERKKGYHPKVWSPFLVNFGEIVEAKNDPTSNKNNDSFFVRFSKHFGYENDAKIDARIHQKFNYFSCEIWESFWHDN